MNVPVTPDPLILVCCSAGMGTVLDNRNSSFARQGVEFVQIAGIPAVVGEHNRAGLVGGTLGDGAHVQVSRLTRPLRYFVERFYARAGTR